MSNVVGINSKRTTSTPKPSYEALQAQVQSILLGPDADNDAEAAQHRNILDDLEALSADILVRKLQLIHRKEAAIRAWTEEEAQMAAEMQAAVYLAYRSGVPEEAIYDLDDDRLSDALSKAINKLEKQA